MKISVSNVKQGMVLSRDLKQQGNILLKEGAVISDHTVAILQKRSISYVDIVYDRAAAPPGSDVLNDDAEQKYLEERKKIDLLFLTVPDDDKQMSIIKYCLVRQLKEEYNE